MRSPSCLVLTVAYAAGAVPHAQLAARLLRGVDLRDHGTGTVSGSGPFEVAGLGPLVAAGLSDTPVEVVDSTSAAGGQALVAIAAARAAMAGADIAGLA